MISSLALPTLFALLANADVSPPAPVAETTPAVNAPGSRLVLVDHFSDGGLITGPRTIRIYLPADYATSSDTYRVLYFNDGQQALTDPDPKADPGSDDHVDQVLDGLVGEGLVYPAILVGIDSGPNNGRFIELTPPNPRDPTSAHHVEDYYKFITTRLKPYIDAHYRTKHGAQFTGIAGSSLGGLASCYLAAMHPKTFSMAGCMSPSLGWDGGKLLQSLGHGPASPATSRFWFDSAPREGEKSWQSCISAARSLIANGWTEGDNVAFQMDYIGEHGTSSWHRRARSMLYFLLLRDPPKLTGLAIKQIFDPDGKPVNLMTVADEPFIILEAQYEHDFRINPVNPVFTVTDPKLATIDAANFDEVHSLAHGETTVTSTYGGFSATQTVQTYGPEDLPRYAKLSCPPAVKPITIDGDLSDWPDLPISFPPAPSAAPGTTAAPGPQCRFGVAYDDKFLYLAVAVTTDHWFIDPKRDVWTQDGIEIRLDARPDPARYAGQGQSEFEKILLLAVSPGEKPDDPTIFQKDRLPKGTRVACRKTKTGYALEAAIPNSYLDEKQKAPWQEFRLNVCVDDAIAADQPVAKYWWNPDWRTPQNVLGSGTFRKAP